MKRAKLPPAPQGPIITSVYAPEKYQDQLDKHAVGKPAQIARRG